MFCLGCGDDLRGKESDRRNIHGSQDVILLWKMFINCVAVDSTICLLTDSKGGLMCRKCHYAYKIYLSFQDGSLCKSLEHITSASCSTQAKRLRISTSEPVVLGSYSSRSSGSPDVAVSFIHSIMVIFIQYQRIIEGSAIHHCTS